MGADHCGGWIKIFGVKASEPETSIPVAKRNCYLCQLHLAPSLRVIPSEFRRDLCTVKIDKIPWAIVQR